jgi:hypothetical protein
MVLLQTIFEIYTLLEFWQNKTCFKMNVRLLMTSLLSATRALTNSFCIRHRCSQMPCRCIVFQISPNCLPDASHMPPTCLSAAAWTRLCIAIVIIIVIAMCTNFSVCMYVCTYVRSGCENLWRCILATTNLCMCTIMLPIKTWFSSMWDATFHWIVCTHISCMPIPLPTFP